MTGSEIGNVTNCVIFLLFSKQYLHYTARE